LPSSEKGYEKKLKDLQDVVEKRNIEMRSALVKIRDMQADVDSHKGVIQTLEECISKRDQVVDGSEKIIKAQSSLLDEQRLELIETRAKVLDLEKDVAELLRKLSESSERNHLAYDKLSLANEKLLEKDGLLSNERRLSKRLESDNRFHDEKEKYLDRMLLQVSSELDECKKVNEGRISYMRDLEAAVAALNVQVAGLHADIRSVDQAMTTVQEKFFYLRTRFFSRVMVKLGVYKVPHE